MQPFAKMSSSSLGAAIGKGSIPGARITLVWRNSPFKAIFSRTVPAEQSGIHGHGTSTMDIIFAHPHHHPHGQPTRRRFHHPRSIYSPRAGTGGVVSRTTPPRSQMILAAGPIGTRADHSIASPPRSRSPLYPSAQATTHSVGTCTRRYSPPCTNEDDTYACPPWLPTSLLPSMAARGSAALVLWTARNTSWHKHLFTAIEA